MHQWRQAIRGARRVGDDVVLFGIVFAFIHAHHDRRALALGRGRDDDLLRAGGEVAFGFLDIREQPRGFDHHVHAQLFPRQLRRVFGAHHLHLLAIDDQHIIIRLVRGGFLRANCAGETALNGIILQEIRQVVGRHDIADGDHTNILPNQSLFDHRPVNQATNAAEPVNCNFYCHSLISVVNSQIKPGMLPAAGARSTKKQAETGIRAQDRFLRGG